jgi:hypothetical protein
MASTAHSAADEREGSRSACRFGGGVAGLWSWIVVENESDLILIDAVEFAVAHDPFRKA